MSAPARDPGVLAATVRLVAFDVDGVMTNGQLILGPSGEELKVFHVRDGHGLVMLRESGLDVAVITGRKSPVVAERMAELGIQHVYQGQRDKLVALAELCERLGVTPEETCYMGDDLPDLPVLRRVGLPTTVADGHPLCQAAALWRASAPGGFGAVRELCEFILAAQGKLAAQFAAHGG